jgi:hypothetical protein
MQIALIFWLLELLRIIQTTVNTIIAINQDLDSMAINDIKVWHPRAFGQFSENKHNSYHNRKTYFDFLLKERDT